MLWQAALEGRGERYAIFHAMCRTCADCFIGTHGSDRSRHAWRQAYRSVNHRQVSERCKNKKIMSKFPNEIEDFGNLFVECRTRATRRITIRSPGTREPMS